MKKFVMAVVLMLVVACTPTKVPDMVVEKGVSLELAEYRKATISKINYALHLTISEAQNEGILTRETVTLTLSDTSQDLQLDFMAEENSITSVVVNGAVQTIVHKNEHLVIDRSALKVGENTVNIKFWAGDTSLNRNPEFLYTIFVPDRARTAFPIFDQPNLKATYDLTLDLPKGWVSIANGPLKELVRSDTRDVFKFEKSDLIPTYLFTFVAGKFEVITRNVDGVDMTMLHRETDEAKVARNLDEIFKLHKASLDWLEDYTGIPYPFKKFGFALIPSFQFGGMEHVGAIHYRASSLFLDEDPSTPRQLGRASLIAHETAHMWFGDLVTMDWFNDVWTKEVFANFMASKIVNPSFPDVDHDLNFLLRSYPSAYSVDRTEGANPIRQYLPNLNEAGTMYGAIIYNKAPVMMMQLEMLVGKETFQKGMQEYLKTYAFGNATWPNLVGILDKLTDEDLIKWSEVWVNTAGRPHFIIDQTGERGEKIKVSQIDPTDKGRVWPQSFTIAGENDPKMTTLVNQNATHVDVVADGVTVGFDNLLINANGKGYGLFPDAKFFVEELWARLSDVQKGAAFVGLYEQLLENTTEIRPDEFLEIAVRVLNVETNPLLVRHVLNRITGVYWTLISVDDRQAWSQDLEAVLWAKMIKAENPAMKKMYYGAFRNVALGEMALGQLKNIWTKTETPEGLKLNEQDYINLAAELAIKIPAEANDIIETQLMAIKNPDRKRRFDFILPALSPDTALRDGFILSLGHENNRQIESWVLGALGYIHHPLRIEQSEKYIAHGLELMTEIQITGDIFFPGRWMGVILGNHRSDAGVATVRDFLAAQPDYNHQMKLKILQSADPMFRANAILKGAR
jgi:aminopeptidase N